ncbi:MAG: DUF6485 family protein [Thermoguttaceae bacterium]|nr:DUF6485 family protein [Thermoguttaceae bacterium]
MECKKTENLTRCTCTATSCERRGMCCECVAHHLAKRQVPGCFFDTEGEKTWNRSFEHFAKLVNEKRI